MGKKLAQYYASLSSAVRLKLILCYGWFVLSRRVDKWFGTETIFAFLGFVIGISIGLWWVVRTATQGDSSTPPPSGPGGARQDDDSTAEKG